MFDLKPFLLVTLAAGLTIGEAAAPAAGWSVEALHGPVVPFRVTLDEATWMSLDVSPDGETLVFDILGDLYTLPIEGGEATRITHGPAYDAQPRFAPDGERIAFVSDRDGSSNLWLVDPDGANPAALTRQPEATFSSPAWTPDGYIVAARHDDAWISGPHELFLFHPAGGRDVRLVGRDRGPMGPAPSPDGRFIYFSRSDELTDSSIERFDRGNGVIHPLVGGYGQAMRPEVSPDGHWLAFGRRTDNETRLVVRDLVTGAERALAARLDHPQLHPVNDADKLPGYAFTPDGTAIIYSARGKIRRHNLANDTSTVIPFRAEFEQSLHRPLMVERAVDDGPVRPQLLRWTHASPDGNTLYFSAAGRNYRYDTATETARAVGDGPGLEYAPAVSPDGRWLAYVSWSDRDLGHLWKVPLAGGEPVRLTERAGLYEHPAWSPDGRKLLFLKSSGGERRGEGNLGERYTKTVRWLDANRGGASHLVTTVAPRGDRRQAMRPTFNRRGDRVFFSETPVRRQSTYLCSVRVDGTDKQRHLEFEFADDLVPSPDGEWLAFTEHFEVYLAPMPAAGAEPAEVRVDGGELPVVRLSEAGGYFVNWSRDGRDVTWGWGPDFYRVSLDDVLDDRDDASPGKTTIAFSEPRAVAGGQMLLRNARLVTMGDAGVIEHGDVLIENGRIVSIGATGRVPQPHGTTVLDVSGKTIIPGLVDIHMHYRASYDTEIFPENDWGYVVHLAYGVTTVRNPSAREQAVFTQAEMIETGRTLGPRVFSTGEPIYFVRTPFADPVTSLDDARNQVRRLKRLGATAVKQYRQPRREQRQWIREAAREEGLLAVAEGAWKFYHNLTTVMDGHTTLEHAFKTEDVYADIRALLAASGIHYTPTLFVAPHGSAGDYFYQQHDVFNDDKLLRFTPYDQVAPEARHRMMRPEQDYYFKRLAESTAEVYRAGGNVAFGAHGNLLGLGAHWELWALVIGGLSPEEALRTATVNSAAAMGLGNDLGSLEAGKLADLVVLDHNPLEDIRNSNTLRYVMKNGLLWDADTMDQVWPERREFAGFYWQRAE